ncbi:sodium:solute symporter [Anoxybacter fermentans]|uniref:Sodium:solute symporter n=1 Tax=Anoxybacter fermentans TaxID=1323375 RepID=A0A3Q9HQD3_9FIRM|nr:sodium:solute symporter family protein [Anoxybacter fermentans]AZR73258.1 sodium:solute symporter [Anoxybacter fermentans]
MVLFIVFLYLVIVLFMGIRAGLNKENSIEEYVAASRSLNLFVMYFLMGGAIFSAFAFLGGPGWAYSKGAASFYILAYCAMGLVPWLIWGPRAYRMGHRYNYVTQAELISDRFESKTLSALMAIVSILAFIQYIALQLKGMAYVLNVTTDGLIPFWLGALIAYGVVLVYVLTSGVRGVAWTNVLQGLFMMIMAWTLGLWLPFKFHGGIAPMFKKIIESNPTHLLVGKPQMSWAAFSSAILVSVLGFTMWPHLFMKAYTTKSEKTLKQTITLYPTFAIFMVPVLFIGFAGIGVVSKESLQTADQILPIMLTKLGLPPVIMGLVAAATLAAAMSSSDTITHGAASVYTLDFHKKVINRNLTDRQAVVVTRIAVIVFCSVAYYIAVFGAKSLVALLLGAYGSIVQFFPLVAATFFWPRATKQGAILGLITGVIVNFYFSAVTTPPFEIHAGIWGLLANTIVLIIVSLLTSPHNEEHVMKFVIESQVPVD